MAKTQTEERKKTEKYKDEKCKHNINCDEWIPGEASKSTVKCKVRNTTTGDRRIAREEKEKGNIRGKNTTERQQSHGNLRFRT